MAKICDNTSVGILVRNDGKLLMIERKQYNFGFALPAGHQDGDDPIACARKELGEEVGLNMEEGVIRLEMTLQNPCKREKGSHHNWSIVEATKWSGDVNIEQPDDEAKSYLWADKELILILVKKLRDFTEQLGIELTEENIPEIVRETNRGSVWAANPGLEPPMYFLFRKLGIF